jgi:NhaP-type Na+/H+ and K+/H+ antiporter
MQISADGSMYALALISKSVCLATIGVCVFCAVTSVAALFVFNRTYQKEELN